MGTWALARVSLGVFVEFSCVGFPSEMMPTVGAPSPDAQEVAQGDQLGRDQKGLQALACKWIWRRQMYAWPRVAISFWIKKEYGRLRWFCMIIRRRTRCTRTRRASSILGTPRQL